MCIHSSGRRITLQPGSAETPAASVVALGLLLALASGAAPTRAQLGVTGFSLFDGSFEGGMLGGASAVGDFNADGFDDLVVGMPELDLANMANAGAISVFLGGPGAWSNVVPFSSNPFGRLSEAGAGFGSALATGDFDDDGHDDLVIGVPGSTINGVDRAGEIIVAYGTSTASSSVPNHGVAPPIFDLARTQVFSQVPLPGAPEEDDRFGSSLAAGDLSADGVDDLAIGIPDEDIQGPLGLRQGVGAVNVMYGLRGVGLTTSGSQLINENSPGVGLNANADERFGFSLAIGQFTHNANTDLAVGVPGEGVFGFGQQGAVVVFPGAPGGLDTLAGEEAVISQRTDGILGIEQDGDEFGYSLAMGNFDGDLFPDLAIGVPGESEFGTTESGAVQVLYGGPVGLVANGNQFLVESSIDADVDAFDRLGMALAAGDFDGDGRDDLSIGAPLDNSLGFANAGEVTVLYGSSAGATFAGHQVFDMIFFDTLEIGDLFGTALAVGRFFSQSQESQDLAVGIPRRGTPVGSEPGASLVIRSLSIFADGFESGDVSDWSNSIP